MAHPSKLAVSSTLEHDVKSDVSTESPTHAIAIPSSLVARVQTQDIVAFRELADIAYASLVRFAHSILNSHDDAKDVVQDVFLHIWDLGPRWTPHGDPGAYLFASVRNHALKEVRRRGRASSRALRAQEYAPGLVVNPMHVGTPEPLELILEAEVNEIQFGHVASVLSELPERYRTIYELRYRRGLTVPMIAQVLGITVKSAECLTARVTRRVLERLRQRIFETD